MIKIGFLVGVVSLSLVGCIDDSPDLSSTEQLALVTICHYDAQGRVRQITIGEDAAAAHEDHHGDHNLLSFYADADGDGYGAGDAVLSCAQPPDTSTNNQDCNDVDPAINPAAAEVCGDNTDNNCDGQLAQSSAVLAFQSSNGQQFNAPQGVCTTHQNVTVEVCRESPTQAVKLSSTSDGTGKMYYDELGTVVVTSPSGTTVGANYRWWEPNCNTPGYPDVYQGTLPTQLDITNLFGSEHGVFTVNVRVVNAFQPYEWFTTWIVPVN